MIVELKFRGWNKGGGAYLEPYLEVESDAGMAGGVEETESDAAIDAAADKNGDSERLMRHGTAEVGVRVDIERRRGLSNGGTEELLQGGESRRSRVQLVELLGCEVSWRER